MMDDRTVHDLQQLTTKNEELWRLRGLLSMSSKMAHNEDGSQDYKALLQPKNLRLLLGLIEDHLTALEAMRTTHKNNAAVMCDIDTLASRAVGIKEIVSTTLEITECFYELKGNTGAPDANGSPENSNKLPKTEAGESSDEFKPTK